MPGRQFFGLAFGPDKHLVGTIAAEALGRLAGLTIWLVSVGSRPTPLLPERTGLVYV
jgi:hypothetical protein